TVPVTLPTPPTPGSLVKGTAQEQAAQFGDLLASPVTRLAAWLGVYDALAIPVLGQDGVALGSTGDDPIGPQYWEVWYASGLDREGRGVPLSDAGRMLAVGAPGASGSEWGRVLLDDLRRALESQDPQTRLLGLLVRERILRGPSHVDVEDPSVTAERTIVDLATLQLVAWTGIRGVLTQSARAAARAHPAGQQETSLAATAALPASSTPCTELLGKGGGWVVYWSNWLLRKVLSKGLPVPGMEKALPGFIERIQRSVDAGDDTIKTTKDALSWINVVVSMLTLAMKLAALEVDAIQEPDPLLRTKGTTHGEAGKVTFALSARLKKPPGGTEAHADGNSLDNCFINFFTNALSINLALPGAGRIAGAELEFRGGIGFPERVLFGNYADLLGKATDANGEATLAVTGTAQKKQLSEAAKPVDREFSILVSAQPEAFDEKSLVNMFFNGYSLGVKASVPGAITAILDVLKTVHWELGEHVFRVTDWKPRGYRAIGGNPYATYSGVICSLDKPFTIVASYEFGAVPFEFVPSSATSGAAHYGVAPSGISLTGSGPYRIDDADTDWPKIVWSVAADMRAPRLSHHGEGSAPLGLVALETNECD
ncbi:MAG TPA: hypothetical protein VJU61_12665, partial [Polyangiaceae bacterium]|nr:hypothetical protein [Polyangiaceae bacterium]